MGHALMFIITRRRCVSRRMELSGEAGAPHVLVWPLERRRKASETEERRKTLERTRRCMRTAQISYHLPMEKWTSMKYL